MFLFQNLVASNSTDVNALARVNRATSKTSLYCKTGAFDAGFDYVDDRDNRRFVRYVQRRDSLQTIVFSKEGRLLCREYGDGICGFVILLYPVIGGRCCAIRYADLCKADLECRRSDRLYLRVCMTDYRPDVVHDMLRQFKSWRQHKFGQIETEERWSLHCGIVERFHAQWARRRPFRRFEQLRLISRGLVRCQKDLVDTFEILLGRIVDEYCTCDTC